MSHTCHAEGCSVEVPPKLFMCKRHWFKLPKKLRDAVWAVYVPGQEIRKDPTARYLIVQAYAVAWVAHAEQRFDRAQVEAHIEHAINFVADELVDEDADIIEELLGGLRLPGRLVS